MRRLLNILNDALGVGVTIPIKEISREKHHELQSEQLGSWTWITKITFKYIPGIQNTLADTLSRLIEIDEDIKLHPEEEGKEFGYFPFEELPPVTTQVIEEVIECEISNINLQHPEPVEIDI